MRVRSLAAVASLTLLASCGEDPQADALADEIIEIRKALPRILDSVKDDATAKNAEAQIEALGNRMESIGERSRNVRPRGSQKERIDKRFQTELSAIDRDLQRSADELKKRAPEQQDRMQRAFEKFDAKVKGLKIE